MSQHFTHLHVHTDFSLLDGAISLDKLIEFGKKNQLKSLCISDHGNVFGGVKFFQQCKKAGIKPILGMEAYLTEDIRIKDADNKYYHLLIVVENAVGYKNLCKLISAAYTDGFYFKPRIDYRLLEAHHEGLIVTTACLGGHIPSLLMADNYTAANDRLDWYLKTFGPERFYLEVQPEDQKEQKLLNEKIYDLSKRRGIQLVATGDCHYPSAEDREAHEVMLAIQTHHKITDPDRFTFGDCRVHLRSTDEMLAQFPGHPDALWASGQIADRCTFDFETGKLFFPHFEIPESYTQETYFAQLCTTGLQELVTQGRIQAEQHDLYMQRLQLEIELIITMGFVGYFLVVSDFIRWAREQEIPVGPGRGSAAGSLVAWSLRITDIDPIKYNLLFERFLNPERVSMPDIDIDFCIEGRDRVINYVREKYGHDKVCQIITFGTMMAKGVIKDVARVLGFPFEDSNALTDLIPDQLKITLKEALEQEPQLKTLQESNPRIQKLFDLATRLEGLTRHASKHAAGIVISPAPINEMIPVYVPPKTNDLVTQYAMTELETLGFLKMDFLGLKNLTLIKQATDLIKAHYDQAFDVTRIPLDDRKTFELLSRGETSGVFQLESEGLKDVLRRLQPACFEDIIAVNALYRPGPLGSGMVDDFIERKHGRQAITYIFPELEPILQETYGVIVYQEQVMKIASTIGRYSLGEADILRRAMGKKKAEEMAKQRSIFVSRALAQQFNETKAGELFDLMAYFAGYGFNKSHSAAYALIAYQTAYLKAHYPAEFLACLISLESSDAEKMAFYMQEAKDCRIQLLPPDINASQTRFSVVDGAIRFGLQGIKNVGLAALENILAERSARGPFKHIYEFCTRVDLRTCNKRVLESLIYAGAFDHLPGNRAQKIEELQMVLDRAIDFKKGAATGQMGLFTVHAVSSPEPEAYHFSPREELSDRIKLEKEKEVVGLYISAQPLDSYKSVLQWIQAQPLAQVQPRLQQNIIVSGVIAGYKVITTKKQEKMAFMTIEDQTGKAEIVIFPKVFNRCASWFESQSMFVIKGVCDERGALTKIKAQECIPLDLVFTSWPSCERILLQLPEKWDSNLIHTIHQTLIPGTIPVEMIFTEDQKKFKITTRFKASLDQDRFKELEKLQISITLSL